MPGNSYQIISLKGKEVTTKIIYVVDNISILIDVF